MGKQDATATQDWCDGKKSFEEINILRQANASRLEAIIDTIGWPTVSKVGRDASKMAWYVAQHSDHDVAFQARCLQLMKQADEGDVEKRNVAFLEDRVRLGQGRKQLYGTQYICQDENTVEPRPMEDVPDRDALRAGMGLCPHAEEWRQMKALYTKG
jgi:hypothetical protein